MLVVGEDAEQEDRDAETGLRVRGQRHILAEREPEHGFSGHRIKVAEVIGEQVDADPGDEADHGDGCVRWRELPTRRHGQGTEGEHLIAEGAAVTQSGARTLVLYAAM